jgi:thiol-disulfide isomerase/thioredoxin
MIELSEDNLDAVLMSNPKVIVQYGATWCGNCKLMKPKFKKLALENPDMTFIYVDAEKFPSSRQYANVNNLPTFAGFINTQLVNQSQGNKIEVIQTVIDSVNETTNN